MSSEKMPPKGSLADKHPRLYEISRFYMDLSQVLTRSGYEPEEQYIVERMDLGMSRAALKEMGWSEGRIEAFDAEIDNWMRDEANEVRAKRRLR